jgi:hypothetical protein
MVDRSVLRLAALLTLLVPSVLAGACIDIDPPPAKNGFVSGRVLVTPGEGLAHATVHVDQLNFYDGRGAVRRHVATGTTDDEGYFEAIPTSTAAGLLLLRTTGGTFRDFVSGETIELDSSTGLRALYRLEFFERREGLLVTPVHSLIEAQFRYSAGQLGDVPLGLRHAQERIGAHFGGVDWDAVVPAEVTQPASSPVDAVRAAFVLGGLSVLADDLRAASDSTPQAVNLFTLLNAVSADLAEGVVDGNDGNDSAPGSGLQVGTCPPIDPSCVAPPGTCQLGSCRPYCDLYSNTIRGNLVGGIRKFIGSRQFPSPWNRTGLGSEDARPMLDQIGGNVDAELFGGACLETADRVSPSIVWEAPEDGAFVKGSLTVKIRAVDDAEALPRALFDPDPDRDGDTTNPLATAVIDTRTANGGVDGPFSLTAVARDAAGNVRRETRTFQADNTAPEVSILPSGFYVEGPSGVWWTGDSEPMLSGTLNELHPRAVELVIAGEVVANATIDGGTWSVRLAAGKVTSGGNELVVRAIDRAGNVTTTQAVQLRLDATAPGVLVESSPVYDELNSTFDESLDVPATNTWLQRHVPGGAPIDLAQSMNGACATVHKFSHLLHESFVLGSTGNLNPMRVNLLVSDDGVGIEPGTSQARVTIRSGPTTTEVLPWTSIPGTVVAPKTTRHLLGLYRDGALAIPQLATTEGEYHLELRARDKLGRTSLQERCWNHRVLAPKLVPLEVSPSGTKATGFEQALYSTSLNPGASQFGNFSAKFLNSNPSGAAVWIWRVKNYLATPVYVHVDISRGVDVKIYRKFVVRNGLTDYRNGRSLCGLSPCTIATPTTTYPDPAVPDPPPNFHRNVQLRARLFVMNGDALGQEILPCSGCANDDGAQTYTFELPARATPQGSPLVEYAVLTHLRSALPAGGGTNVFMAPSDAQNPDTDPAPYSEFTLNQQTLTGKLLGGVGPDLCTDQEQESGQWFCIEKARRQRYRALTSITYDWLEDLQTVYSFSATPSLSGHRSINGTLSDIDENIWSTSEIINLP